MTPEDTARLARVRSFIAPYEQSPQPETERAFLLRLLDASAAESARLQRQVAEMTAEKGEAHYVYRDDPAERVPSGSAMRWSLKNPEIDGILYGHEERRPEETLNRRIAAALTAAEQSSRQQALTEAVKYHEDTIEAMLQDNKHRPNKWASARIDAHVRSKAKIRSLIDKPETTS